MSLFEAIAQGLTDEIEARKKFPTDNEESDLQKYYLPGVYHAYGDDIIPEMALRVAKKLRQEDLARKSK